MQSITVAALANPAEARLVAGGMLPRHKTHPRGTSRPLRNTLGSATVAAMAVAMIGPMPGMLARHWLIGAKQMICASVPAVRVSTAISMTFTAPITSADRLSPLGP